MGSTSTRGGTPPYLAPYFAAGGDGLAGDQLCRRAGALGIETVIVSPGVYTGGTNHFAHADQPGDNARAVQYAAGPTRELAEQAKQADFASVPADADPADVARAIVRVVGTPYDSRPLRVTIDPADGRADEHNKRGDRVRAAYLCGASMADLLRPAQRADGQLSGLPMLSP